MKIAIIGSREFKDKEFVQNIIGAAYYPEMSCFISGGARGVDSWAEENIDIMNAYINDSELEPCLFINKKIFKPDWNKYGKKAGFLRNKLIIDEADKIIVFWNGKSKGTKHSIDLGIKAGKPIDIYIRP